MFAIVTALVLSAAATPTELVDRMQKTFEAAQDFSADFLHTHYAAARKGKGRAEKG